jgi:putative transport protein
MQWLRDTLQTHPEIAIFLALSLGFLVGTLKIGKFSLGSVTGVLLAGVLIGQFDIHIASDVKSVFFLMFLFAVGYGVGPQFFRGLKSDGVPQVVFSVLLCVACLGTAVAAGKILGYHSGETAGLLAGACTISAVLGVAGDSIGQLALGEPETKRMLDAMPVAYAVTYLFGTAGSAWVLAGIGPWLLGGGLPAKCKELEKTMGVEDMPPGVRSAYIRFIARSFKLTTGSMIGKTVGEFERHFADLVKPARVFIERVRREGKILDATPDFKLEKDDIIAVIGRREVLLDQFGLLGTEVEDPELMDFRVELLSVVVTNSKLTASPLKEIVERADAQVIRGVFLRRILRADQEMPISPGFRLDRGDVVEIVGTHRDVERVAKILGYADRITDQTDVVFMGLGIALGALVGTLAVKAGGIPLSLSTSGGALIAGLVCGWLRSVNRTFGRIPGPALWVMNNIGLTIFIAVVGISAGPTFVSGLKAAGVQLLVAGVVVTSLPLILGLLMGRFVFRFHPAITLGACAGARTTTAALGAIQDACRSNVPALGYTVPYAVGNTLLTIWGVVIVTLMK